jgi:NMD protein affecting ribosome stability and mRNA decay
MSRRSRRPEPGRDPRQGAGRTTHHDPYHLRAKAAGNAQCPDCGLVQHQGRWKRDMPAGEARRQLCPACQRIRDRFPAGTVRLREAPPAMRAELLQRLRNVEQAESAEHPLERIMAVEERGGDLVVTTTGTHLARRIADAIERSFHGHAEARYPPDEATVQVDWRP